MHKIGDRFKLNNSSVTNSLDIGDPDRLKI